MRRRTTLLVGGATAAALALGGLVGGVLAESRSAAVVGRSRGARRSGARGSGRRHRRSPRRGARAAGARAAAGCGSLRSSASRISCAGGRPPTRPSFRAPRRRCASRSIRRRGCRTRFSGSARSRSSSTSFATALALRRRAEKLLPGSSRPYGVIGDALVELGRYDAAFAAFERMVTLRPSLASYARIAYARELLGDRDGAAAAMRLALEAAAGQPEPTAWALVELAKLELGPS